MSAVTIDQQIAEVGREIGLRRKLFPGFIARGKLTQAAAAEHLARMEAAYDTLKAVRDNPAALMRDDGK